MKLKYKQVRQLQNPPRYHSPGASGIDVEAAIVEPLYIPAGGRAKVPTGLAVQIDFGWEGQVRPRSGLAAKLGLVAVVGTIDCDYRQEISVVLVNHGVDMVTVNPGDRIAQLVICPVEQCDLEEVDELTETERNGGFGSTGGFSGF